MSDANQPVTGVPAAGEIAPLVSVMSGQIWNWAAPLRVKGQIYSLRTSLFLPGPMIGQHQIITEFALPPSLLQQYNNPHSARSDIQDADFIFLS